MFTSEKNKKAVLRTLIIYASLTVVTAIFGGIYEFFSHNVYSAHMVFAWAFVLFGVIPYLLFFLLPIKRVPSMLTACIYNFGVAMLTVRSIFIGVIDIYGTTNAPMLMIYTILSVVFLTLGALLYFFGLFFFKEKEIE